MQALVLIHLDLQTTKRGDTMKQRTDGRWQKVKTIDGKKVFFYSTAKTEKQAIKDIENQMLEFRNETHYSKFNFKCIADKAIALQANGIQNNTELCYNYTLKHLEAFFDYDINEITAEMAQSLIDDMSLSKGYSFSAVSKVKTLLSLIMDYAIVHEKIPLVKFTRSLKIPKGTKKGKITSPPDFVTEIIIKNADIPFGDWVLFLLCTGLRRGEQAALKVCDIDLANRTINLNRVAEYTENQAKLKDIGKTDESLTSVPILDLLYPYVEEIVKKGKPTDFIFGGDAPLSVCALRKRLDNYCKEIGYRFTGHQLRHAYAKLLYKAGVDVKTAQRLLRHKNFNTTMNIYTDFSNEVTNKSVQMINNYTNKIV